LKHSGWNWRFGKLLWHLAVYCGLSVPVICYFFMPGWMRQSKDWQIT